MFHRGTATENAPNGTIEKQPYACYIQIHEDNTHQKNELFFKKKKKNRKGQGWGWERRGRALLSSWRAWQNISPSSCVSCKFFLKTRKRRGKVKIIFATFKSYLSTDIWNSTRFPGVHWFAPILPRDSVSYSQHHVHWEESLYLWK